MYINDYITINIMNEILDLYRKKTGQEFDTLNILGKYGGSNPEEFFAEAFTLLESGVESDIAEVMKMLLIKYNMLKK